MLDRPSRLLTRVSEPASEPVSLAEAKTFLRIDGSDDDSLISDQIAAARIVAEELTGTSLITQSWKLAFDNHAPQCTSLPHGPVQSITSVTAYDEQEQATVIAGDQYHLNAALNQLLFDGVVNAHRVEIEYVTGYGNAASDVPADIRQGMLVHIAHMHTHRDQVSPPVIVEMMYAKRQEVRL